MYLTYTICSHYHDTTKVAYCVPILHNMLPLPKCYQGSILCTLPTQYAPIIILLPHYHTTKVAYCESKYQGMSGLFKTYSTNKINIHVPMDFINIFNINKDIIRQGKLFFASLSPILTVSA